MNMKPAITVDYGRLPERSPTYGLPVNCYVCGAEHKGLNLARIRDGKAGIIVALCERCCDDNDAVVRKYWKAPELEVLDGGEATAEQIEALAGKHRAGETEH
jgi:hypothetical protein